MPINPVLTTQDIPQPLAHVPACSGYRTAEDLLREVMAWHRDPESPDYNECEKDPCAWCTAAAAVAVRGPDKSPDSAKTFSYAPWTPPFRYNAAGQRIVDSQGNRLLDVRGWGFLTGSGLRLGHAAAAKVQDTIGERVVAAINRDAAAVVKIKTTNENIHTDIW